MPNSLESLIERLNKADRELDNKIKRAQKEHSRKWFWFICGAIGVVIIKGLLVILKMLKFI